MGDILMTLIGIISVQINVTGPLAIIKINDLCETAFISIGPVPSCTEKGHN